MSGPIVRMLTGDTAPLTARRVFERGDPGPIAASLAHVPELLEVGLPFFGRALRGVTVGLRTAELVIVRASAVLGCRYCTLTHAAVALDADVTPEEVRALCSDQPAAAARDDRERSLLAWVDAVAAGHGPVVTELTDAMSAWADDATLIELTTMVGCTVLLNRYCSSLGLPVSAGSMARLDEAGVTPDALGFGEGEDTGEEREMPA